MKRRFIFGLVALVLFTPASIFSCIRAGQFLGAPAQKPEQADLIVSLGGDNGGRVHKAAMLFHQGFAPNILLTGMEGGNAKTRPDYWRSVFLIEQGVSERKLMFDSASATSWDEAINTLNFMEKRDFRRILVVSDPPHLRRLEWVWGKVFKGSGREFRLIASDMDGWDAAHWWRDATSARYVVTEFLKLGYYLVVHL